MRAWAGPYGNDLTGGWLNGGPAGNLKMTMPTAFTVSLLAWGLLSFPAGYSQANATGNTLAQIRCRSSAQAVPQGVLWLAIGLLCPAWQITVLRFTAVLQILACSCLM